MLSATIAAKITPAVAAAINAAPPSVRDIATMALSYTNDAADIRVAMGIVSQAAQAILMAVGPVLDFVEPGIARDDLNSSAGISAMLDTLRALVLAIRADYV